MFLCRIPHSINGCPLLDLIGMHVVLMVPVGKLVLSSLRRDFSPGFLWKAAKRKERKTAQEEEAAG